MVKFGSTVSGTTVRPAWASFVTSLAVCLVLAATCCGQQTEAAIPETTIRVDVRLVRLLATVKDPSGNAIGTLDKSAFTVRDNGAPRPSRSSSIKPISLSTLLSSLTTAAPPPKI